MNKLTWQLPWFGPRLDDARESPAWSVGPAPGLGDAQALCVPVTTVNGVIRLALAETTRMIPLVTARLDDWTQVTARPGQAHAGYLCLLGYDQSDPVGNNTWLLELSKAGVSPTDLSDGLKELQGRQPDLPSRVLPRPVGPAPAAAAVETRYPYTAPSSASAPVASSSAAINRTDAPAPVTLTLAFASCQYPAGLLDALPAQASLQRLADRLDDSSKRRPERLLLLGDQIYADATAGLLDPARLADRYRLPYEELLRIEPLKRITGRIPVSWMLDDHEIVDNWEPYVQGATGKRFRRGVDAYWRYQRGKPSRDRTWFRVPGKGWRLFVADTRTHRDARSEATLEHAEILGPIQAEQLEAWLARLPHDDLKLVAAPAMLLPRVIDGMDEPLHLDNWQGYPASLHRLLAWICDNEIENVVYLSGDAHLSCDAQITVRGPTGKTVRLRALHAPALYAPLPFANEQPWNLAMPHDQFEFKRSGATYRCSVDAAHLPQTRDGSCLLLADRDEAGHWQVTCELV